MIDYNKYLVIPFVDRGRDFSGCDCWGMVFLHARHEFGLFYPTLDGDYETSDDGDSVQKLIEAERNHWQEIEHGSEQPGDFVTLFVKSTESHVGTVIAPGKMLQTMKSTGATIESYLRNPWQKRVRRFYRWKQ